jgi:hypothetical protein
MFTADDIQGRVRRQPFVPLRITTGAGETFDVHHRDLIMVGRREITVGQAAADDPTVFERAERILLMHIRAMGDLPLPPASSGGR